MSRTSLPVGLLLVFDSSAGLHQRVDLGRLAVEEGGNRKLLGHRRKWNWSAGEKLVLNTLDGSALFRPLRQQRLVVTLNPP